MFSKTARFPVPDARLEAYRYARKRDFSFVLDYTTKGHIHLITYLYYRINRRYIRTIKVRRNSPSLLDFTNIGGFEMFIVDVYKSRMSFAVRVSIVSRKDIYFKLEHNKYMISVKIYPFIYFSQSNYQILKIKIKCYKNYKID